MITFQSEEDAAAAFEIANSSRIDSDAKLPGAMNSDDAIIPQFRGGQRKSLLESLPNLEKETAAPESMSN